MQQPDSGELQQFFDELKELVGPERAAAFIKDPALITALLIDENEDVAKKVSSLANKHYQESHPLSHKARRIAWVGFFAAGMAAVLLGRRMLKERADNNQPRS